MSTITAVLPRREQGATVNIAQGVVIGLVLTALSYGVGLGFGWIDSLNWLEVFAVFTSYICTFLCVVERRINYPIGALSTAAYMILFYQYDLMASMAINAFLVVYLIYGWFRWQSDADPRPVTRMTLPSWAIHLGVAIVSYFIIVGLATLAGGSLVWTDSVILPLTVLAQFMMDNKKFENWYVWLVLNGFAIYTYFAADLTLVGFQYIFFFLNCFYGLWAWSKTGTAVAVEPAQSPVVEDEAVIGAETSADIPAAVKERYSEAWNRYGELPDVSDRDVR